MSTDLRILIDEMVPVGLIRSIESISAIRAVYAGNISEIAGKEDDAVINYARKEERILFTLERRFEKYGVCSGKHVGIIILTVAERHEAIRSKVLENFVQSGHRKNASDCITRVSHGKAEVTSHSGKQIYRFDR